MIALAVEAGGVGYALTHRGGLQPHSDCNATAVAGAVGEVLVFSLQPEVSHRVRISSVRLTDPSPGLDVVALGYRPPEYRGSSVGDPTDPRTVRDPRGLTLTRSDQQPFVALVRATRAGILTVSGFDVRYREGALTHTQHYSDAFAVRAGSDQSPVTEIRFVDCSRWERVR